MTSFNRKIVASNSAIFEFASIIIVVLIGCTAAALNQRPLNAAVEMQGQTSFVCSSDIGVPQWVYSSSNGKSNKDDKDIVFKSDYCSVYPEDAFHLQTQMSNSNKTCALNVRNATMELAGVYTCIDRSSKDDRFSALLTVIDPNPTITVDNQSMSFEGQELIIYNISCGVSYAAPLSPAPALTPSVYFSAPDGQRVSNATLVVRSDQVKAFYSIASKLPIVPSFTCNLFFPTLNETKKQYADNAPTVTYSWSSPVTNISRAGEFKTDAPFWTTTVCESGSCGENRQNVNTSTDDGVENNDWQSIDDKTGGDNKSNAGTSNGNATTTFQPKAIGRNESVNGTDDDTYYITDDDDRRTDYVNETRPTNDDTDFVVVVNDYDDDYDDNRTATHANETRPITEYDTDFPDLNNKTSETESSYSATDIDGGRTNNVSATATYYQNDLPIWNNTISNWTDIAADGNETTNYINETTTNSQMDFPNWSKNASNSTDIVVDGGRTTNTTDEATARNETDFPNLNKTIFGTEFWDNSTLKNTTTIDQGLNATTNLTTELTNMTKGGGKSTTRNIFDFENYVDKFLNSTFPFNALNELFPNFFRNEAPHIIKASFSLVVTSVLIFMFFIN